jgi:hypothetical protein
MTKQTATDRVELGYEHFLEELEAQSAPILKAQCYLYCVAYALVLQREGREDIEVPFDEATSEGLELIAQTPPGLAVKPMAALAKECRAFLKEAPVEYGLPDTLCDHIVKVWRYRLDLDFQILFIQHAQRLGDKAPSPRVLEWLRACARESDKVLKRLPCPLSVAERLRQMSEDLYISGSPLFAWWDYSSDIEKAEAALQQSLYLRPTSEHIAPTHWATAPQAVREWDIVTVRDILMKSKSTLTLAETWGSWLTFLRDVPAKAIDWIIEQIPELSTSAPRLEFAAASIPEGAKAIYPIPALQVGEANLKLESKGVDDRGIWTIDAFTKPYIRPSQLPEGQPLTRLSIRSHQNHALLCSDFSRNQHWTLKVPLAAAFGLSLLVDCPKDLRDLCLAELLSKAPNKIFDWFLGTETGPNGAPNVDGESGQ